ncbi:uncharacterized protein IUM83_06488 [Phytophthora cinnamomi]|uniref:uncharacterized protein n=1 Tax=Phytophthora cinnamomi TaxID=4785 RepID=UPI00355ACADF|nr:putative membrane protein [Phytophthora cinnamomi]
MPGRCFERHQENAQWTQQLLDGAEAAVDAPVAPRGLTASPEELKKQVEAQKTAADALEQQLKQQLKQQKEAQEEVQRRFEEMLTTLKAAVKQCEQTLENEKTQLLTSKPRKMEIVRL